MGPGVDVLMRLSLRVSALEAFQSRHQFEIGRQGFNRFGTDQAAIARERRPGPVDSLGHPDPSPGLRLSPCRGPGCRPR